MLTSRPAWSEIGVRALRNAIQVALPVIALAATGVLDSAGVIAVAAAAGLAGVLSVLKSLAGWTVDPAAPVWQQLTERSVAAAAGAVAGLLPLDLQGALVADWRAVAIAAGGAAILSLATWAVAVPAGATDSGRGAA